MTERFRQLALRWQRESREYQARELMAGREDYATAIACNAAAAWLNQLANELLAEIRAAEIKERMEAVV